MENKKQPNEIVALKSERVYTRSEARKYMSSGLATLNEETNELIEVSTGLVLGIVEEKKEVKRNSVVERVLLINASKSKSGKLGLDVLRYNSIDEKTGQVVIKKSFDSEIVNLVSSYIKGDWQPHYERFINMKVLTSIYVSIAGDGDYLTIDRVFTPEQEEFLSNIMP